jgi:hypothetical protein
MRQQAEMPGGFEQSMQMVLRVKHSSSLGGSDEEEGEASSRSALSAFKDKEEQIERRKTEVREKVFLHLGRVEESSKRLAFIRQVRRVSCFRTLPPDTYHLHGISMFSPC